MRALVLALVALALLPPVASAQEELDAVVAIEGGADPAIVRGAGLVALNASEPGVRYRLDLVVPDEYATLEVRATGLGLDRPRQLVPSLVTNASEYPLFHPFPDERVWEVDGPGYVFHANGTGDALVLRLGIAGPRNVTLSLDVDRVAPTLTVGERREVTHRSFLQETRTDELAIVDLQVRRVGATEWVRNPTPAFHVLQRFPIQGLDASTEYEARFVAFDWAGNERTTEPTRFTTPAAPVLPLPRVSIVSPEDDATLSHPSVVVVATIESPESPVARQGVRLFFDLREIHPDKYTFDGRTLTYEPDPLPAGLHRVSVEATNQAGGRGDARWGFTIAAAEQPTPAPAFFALVALALAAAIRLRA